MTRKKTTIAYVKSSGNIFAELGLPHPERALLKAGLTLQIFRIIKARHLTEVQTNKTLGITRPRAALLIHNRSVHFSVERADGFPDGARARRRPRRQLMPRIPSASEAAIFLEVTRLHVTVNVS